jgi:putative endonuclease
MNRRSIGTEYEKAAGAFLMQHGYRILEYNYRCSRAEIDIVAREGRFLVFAEVKYRKNRQEGSAAEAADERKKRRIRMGAAAYLKERRCPLTTPVRFDVVSIDAGKIRLIRNAFLFR